MKPIIVDPCVLMTGASIVVSAAVTWYITWYFSKRRYSRPAKQITATDIELERVKNEHRSEIVAGVVLSVFVLTFFGILALMFVITA